MSRGLLLALVAAACLVSGCDGLGSDEPARGAERHEEKSVGPRVAGSVVQYADCDDWRRGTKAQREATVRELRDQLTAQSASDTTSPLPDARAYRVLQRTCAQSFSRSLRLYKLYARVQGFAPLSE